MTLQEMREVVRILEENEESTVMINGEECYIWWPHHDIYADLDRLRKESITGSLPLGD